MVVVVAIIACVVAGLGANAAAVRWLPHTGYSGMIRHNQPLRWLLCGFVGLEALGLTGVLLTEGLGWR